MKTPNFTLSNFNLLYNKIIDILTTSENPPEYLFEYFEVLNVYKTTDLSKDNLKEIHNELLKLPKLNTDLFITNKYSDNKWNEKKALANKYFSENKETFIEPSIVPESVKRVHLIIGQTAAGKSATNIEYDDNGMVKIDTDQYRMYDPDFRDLSSYGISLFEYSEFDLTQAFSSQINENIRLYCDDNKLSYTIDTSLGDSKGDVDWWYDELYKKQESEGIDIEISVLATNPTTSAFFKELRYLNEIMENGNGRNVTNDAHTKSANNVLDFVQRLDVEAKPPKIHMYTSGSRVDTPEEGIYSKFLECITYETDTQNPKKIIQVVHKNYQEYKKYIPSSLIKKEILANYKGFVKMLENSGVKVEKKFSSLETKNQ